jgi:hypothetical protein
MRRRAGLSPLAALAAAALVGCGSTPLSTTQLRNQATHVCIVAGKVTDRIPAPSSPAGGAAFLARGAAVLGPELQALRALKPPSDLAQVYTTSLSAFTHKLDALAATIHNLNAGGDPVIAIKTLEQRLEPIEVQENTAWQTLQIPACVNR